METPSNYIVFMIIASLGAFAMMLFVVIDLFLNYRNRQLKHKNDLLALNSKFEKEILEVKNEVTEQVFNDIASELHDNICQILSLAVVQINQSETKIGPNQYTSNSRDSIRQALTDIRSLSHSLSGDYWKNFDIYTYLKQLTDRIIITDSINTNFNISPYVEFDTKDHEIIVIRILQELVNNSIKHSKASFIDLSITTEKDGIHIVYIDNGIGMDESKTSDGMGMLSIKERLTLLKAKWEIKSESQKGFRFDSTIPIV